MRLVRAAWWGLLLSGGAFAHDAGSDQARAAIEHKERFVRQLLADSPVTRRVEASVNDEAKALLALAQQQYRSAQERIRGRDLAGAEKSLNEAIWNVGKARTLVPDRVEHLIVERVRYSRLKSVVDAMRASYLRRAGLSEGEAARSEDADLRRADALVDEARGLADAERVIEANKALEMAELAMLNGLTRLLGAATLHYASRFASQDEEFAWELDRNSSYRDLVPVALREFRPRAGDASAVDGRLARNAALRERAQAHAARGDWKEALHDIRAGTIELQAALAAAGLVMPADPVAEQTR